MIKDNRTDELKRLVEDQAKKALRKCALLSERYAKVELSKPKPHADGVVRPNVDTGLLRNSITTALGGESPRQTNYRSDDGTKSGFYSGTMGPMTTDGGEPMLSVSVGTNVEYAPYVEMGTYKMSAYPYIKPAIQDHITEYQNIITEELSELNNKK